ncbi:MAG: hypothetical protein ACK413_03250 [Patescibacteria group bacterium]
MKIVKEDQNLMVIKDRNVFIFLCGIIFVLFGFLIIFKPNLNKPPRWFGFIGILTGLFTVFAAKTTTIILDKNTGKLVLRWKSLIKEESKEYDLGQIKQLELRQVYTSDSKGRGSYSYKLVFILNTGEEILLNPYGSSIRLQVMAGQLKIIDKLIGTSEKLIGIRIANFLNIPFQERRPPTVTEVLSTIRETVQKEIEKYKKK